MIESDVQGKEERVLAETQKTEDEGFDISLRPQRLDDFIGQTDLKRNLQIFLEAAKKREEPIEHVLLHGNPGLGKTTLASVIANEVGAQIKITSGPALEKVGDLAAILSNLQRGDILFIDEIHRLNKSIEEVLYPAMEDYALDLIVGKGPSARTMRLNLERFTVIGATTRLSLLSAPLRDRFGFVHRLQFYSDTEMTDIIARSSKLLSLESDRATSETIAKRARRTPRIANRLLKRVRDYADVRHDSKLNPTIANEALDHLAVDPLGLDATDRHILTTIQTTFSGGPVGLSTLAAATREETSTLEDIYEPFLLQIGFLKRTPRGRVITEAAQKHLGA